MTDLVDPNEPVAIDPPTFEYSWDFDLGLGPWTTWLAPSVVHEAGGQYENFTRLNAPGLLDPNHLDGIGALRLVAHLSIPAPGSPGALNLIDGEFEITVRGTDFQANGAKLVVWIVKYIPEEGVFKNYYVGLTATNWANTGNDLAPLLTDDWQTLTVSLSDDPADWTYAGTNNTQQGDWGDRYQEYGLGESLANVNTTLHLVLLSDEPDNPPTGFLDLANITVRTQTPATPTDGPQPELFYGLEDQVTNGSLAGDPSVDPESAVFAVVGGTVRNGEVSIDPDTGAFTFTPDPDYYGRTRFAGPATFDYTVSDGVNTVQKTAHLFIGAVNDAPFATVHNEAVEIAADEPFSYSLFKGTDVDVDERLTFRLVDGSTANGTVFLDPANGRYVFTPTAGFSGQASFSYVVSDGQVDSAPKTVTLTVLPAGQEPARLTFNQATDLLIAGDYQAFVYHTILLADAGDRNAAYHYGTWLGAGLNVIRDTTLAAQYLGQATGLLADANLQLASLYVSGDGVDKDYAMARSLLEAIPNNATAIYRLATLDDLGLGGPENDAAAVAGYIRAAELGNADAMYTLGRRYLSGEGVAVSAADAYFWLGVGLKLGGGPNIAQFDALLVFNMQQAADLGLTPEQRADLDSAIAAWTVGQPVPVNDAPVPGEETAEHTGSTNQMITGTLAVATDPDGETPRYELVAGSAQNGTVTINAQTGEFVFTPAAGYSGPASFRYVVSDGQANSGEVEVALVFESVTAAAPDATSVSEAGSLSASTATGLLANDSVSGGGGSIVVSSVNGSTANVGQTVTGTYGDITIQADGSYVYQAHPSTAALIQGQTAVETINYVIRDAGGVTSGSTLTITIQGVGGTVIVGSGTIIGSQFGDILTGGEGSDTIVGQGGDDIIDGGAGATDEVYGGTGNDTFIVRVTGDTIVEFENEGTDTVQTALSAYTLRLHVENLTFTGVGDFIGTGTEQDNLITGGAGNDTLSGLGGSDILAGGAGADVLNGGDGFDTADYTTSAAGVTVSLRTGTGSGGDAAGDTLAGIEALVGSGFDDILAGGIGNNTLNGGGGIDTVDYGAAAAGVTVRLNTGVANNDGDGGADTLSSVENVIGSAFNDTLIGDAGANVLNGGSGADTLIGLAGDDVLIGGAGATNALQGGLGNDRYVVSVAGDTLIEFSGEGIDTVETTLSSYTLRDHFENLTFTGAGAFTGTGNGAANVLTGGAGNDSLDGRGGADLMTGGLGDDAYVLDDIGDVIIELAGQGTDTVRTSLNAYVLGDHLENLTFVGAGAFVGAGNALDNIIIAGAGDDRLISGAGQDRFEGGAGRDTVDYDGAASGVRAQLNSGAATNDGDGGTDTFSGIENLTGSAFNDTLIGDALDNVLNGGLGTDTLIGLAGDDVLIGGAGATNALQGGLGNDRYVVSVAGDTLIEFAGEGVDTVETTLSSYTLRDHFENLTFTGTGAFIGTGNGAANTLTGAAANDVLIGRGGNDLLVGGAGIDTASYVHAAAGVRAQLNTNRALDDGEGGTDTFSSIENLTGSAFNDTLIGDAAANVLSGGDGSDVLIGLAGDDVLIGGAGPNTLQGGLGNDRYVVSVAGDTLTEFAGEGIDTVETTLSTYTLKDHFENLTYTGAGAFNGAGNSAGNVIVGGAADDVLRGMGGNDTIHGGAGTDEVRLRGVAAEYTVTAEGAGYRIVDSVEGRDGSTYVESIERLRYADNASQILTYGAPGALEPTDKAVGEDFGDPLITNPLGDDGFVLPKTFDGPQVMPAPTDEGLFIDRVDLAERIATWRQQMDGGNNPLVIDGPNGPQRFHDGLGDTDPWS